MPKEIPPKKSDFLFFLLVTGKEVTVLYEHQNNLGKVKEVRLAYESVSYADGNEKIYVNTIKVNYMSHVEERCNLSTLDYLQLNKLINFHANDFISLHFTE